MDDTVRALLADRDASDREVAYQALVELFERTERPVPWAYDVWDGFLEQLTDKEGSKRSFAAQLLTRLAISDPEGRMLEDFPRVAAVLRDDKTVTARHTLQSIWRVGLAGPAQRELVCRALEERFAEAGGEKATSLVRRDVVTALGHLFGATGDEAVEAVATALIASEPEEKERKKQRAAWRKAGR